MFSARRLRTGSLAFSENGGDQQFFFRAWDLADGVSGVGGYDVVYFIRVCVCGKDKEGRAKELDRPGLSLCRLCC